MESLMLYSEMVGLPDICVPASTWISRSGEQVPAPLSSWRHWSCCTVPFGNGHLSKCEISLWFWLASPKWHIRGYLKTQKKFHRRRLCDIEQHPLLQMDHLYIFFWEMFLKSFLSSFNFVFFFLILLVGFVHALWIKSVIRYISASTNMTFDLLFTVVTKCKQFPWNVLLWKEVLWHPVIWMKLEDVMLPIISYHTRTNTACLYLR